VKQSDLFIGVPVFRGVGVVEETLRSIQQQTYGDFRVVISVDNADRESAAACEPFTQDPRFELVIHDTHLGWHGNFNWLVEHADLPYFSYWQQDDLADEDYLERLRAELAAHPDAAIAFADIQWFGARTDLQTTPSIIGDRASRVREHILRLSHIPFLGLMRTAHLPRIQPQLRDTPEEASQQEFVFLARMAAAGTFRRVDGPLYHKRARDTSTHLRFQKFPEARRRREWLTMGGGLLEVAAGVHRRAQHDMLAEFVAERLGVHLPDRDYFYLPAALDREITRFVTELLVESPLPELAVPRRPRNRFLERVSHPAVRAGVEAAVQARRAHTNLERSLRRDGETSVGFREGEDGALLLGQGWSIVGPDGTWSHSDEATILLPELPEGRWQLTIEGVPRPSPPGAPSQSLGWALGPDEPEPVPIGAGRVQVRFDVGPGNRGGTLRLAFPDAASPASLGLSEDGRHLGFLLESIELSRA